MDVSVIIPIYKGNGYIESLLNKIVAGITA